MVAQFVLPSLLLLPAVLFFFASLAYFWALNYPVVRLFFDVWTR